MNDECPPANDSHSTPLTGMSRRGFLVSTMATGFALAVRPTYSITRCKTCGTPLPAEEDAQNVYLTTGTLDDPLDAGIKNHIFYGSRADWDRDADDARYFVERSSGPECTRTR